MNNPNRIWHGWVAGLTLAAAFLPLPFLPRLDGDSLPFFLACFGVAGVVYFASLLRLRNSTPSLVVIWTASILARLALLATSPALSDDVYRYAWDGHLLHQGINPYAEAAGSPQLDAFETPLRAWVNQPQMATPYLPAAQVYFWLLELVAPQQVKAYQASAMMIDLLTGLVIMGLLQRLGLQRKTALAYLWNPLVIVEFSHSAHVDVLMVLLTMLAWRAVFTSPARGRLSAALLVGAFLTKGIPALFSPLLLKRWQRGGIAVFLVLSAATLFVFSVGAGWGLGSEMDGRGIFGAVRIYAAYWQFNSGPLFNLVTGLPWLDSETAGRAARGLLMVIFLGMLAFSVRKAWILENRRLSPQAQNLALIRLGMVPASSYILLSPTVHPWYVALVIAFLPFLVPAPGEPFLLLRRVIPWIYFSLAAAFTYLAYLPGNGDEVPNWVLWLEYLPLYAGLIWSEWTIAHGMEKGSGIQYTGKITG